MAYGFMRDNQLRHIACFRGGQDLFFGYVDGEPESGNLGSRFVHSAAIPQAQPECTR